MVVVDISNLFVVGVNNSSKGMVMSGDPNSYLIYIEIVGAGKKTKMTSFYFYFYAWIPFKYLICY
jgi:hypothetical protein